MGGIAQLTPRQPDADVVRLLEEALERAQAGKTLEVAILEVCGPEHALTSFHFYRHYHTLHSAAQRLAAKLANEPDD